MRVVIIGAGEVGTSIAATLSADHTVVVVEQDSDRAEQLKYELDVLSIAGDGTTADALEEAGTDEADMFIACTDDDRANLVACGTAKTLGEPFTIARAKSMDYLRTWERTQEAFGVDYLVCSNLLTAENIVRVIGLPAAVDVDPFVGGEVHMAEFEVGEESPIAGQTVAEADRFDSLTFAGLFRDGEMLVPDGSTVIEPWDRAVVIGSPESVHNFALDIKPNTTPGEADDIVIAGGTEIGYHTARLLEDRSLKPRLIEADHERARELAEELPKTVVMEHDATDTDFLSREHVDEADVLVATMPSDERNLLVAVLAKRLGVSRVMAVVDNTEYVALFEEIGIDVAVNPREITAEEITRFSFESAAENLSVLENDQAEVLELEIGPDSGFVDRSIQDIDTDLSGQFVIGAIVRNHSYVIPRGDTVLQAGDSVVVFVESDFADDLMAAGC
jgi:trk system potassium uptake protein TrkA